MQLSPAAVMSRLQEADAVHLRMMSKLQEEVQHHLKWSLADSTPRTAHTAQ